MQYLLQYKAITCNIYKTCNIMLLEVILSISVYSSSGSILTMDTLLDRLRKNNPDDNARANRHAVTFLAHKEIIAALNDG